MAFTAGYKVNEGTQFEFTVSDETIEEMVQADGGITDADITPYCFTAFFDSRIDALLAMPEPPYYESGSAGSWMSTYCASLVDPSANLPNHVYYNADIVPYNATQVYQRNFLTWYGEIYPGTENAKWGNFLVMDIANIKNWYMEFDEGNNFVQGSVESSSICPGYTGPVWSYISNSLYHFGLHSNNNDPLQHPDENLWVRNILVIGEDVWIGNMNPSNYGSQNLSSTYSRNPNVYQGPHVGSPVYNNGDTSDWPKMFQKGQHSWLAFPTFPNPELPDSGTVERETGSVSTGMVDYEVCTNDMVIQNNFHYADDYWGADKTDTSVVADTVCTQLSTVLKMQAWCGLMFHFQDKYYKPVVSGGVITGYTDDMTQESDWDDITNVTGNNISPYPPVPPPSPEDDSDWDDIPINGDGIGGGSAFCRFYYCTEAELANLRTWTMGLSEHGDPIPGGFDPKSNIIGLTVFPFTVSGNGPDTIKFTTNGGQDPVTGQPMPRVVDSGVACEGGAGATVRKLNATIDVPATMKSRGEPWLDYESYVELYIPLCGVYQVDPQVVIGRTIHVEIFLDPVSGTVMGIAWVPKDSGKCIIAQGSGTPGVQIPVAVGNYGLAQAARVQNTLGAFSNTATSSISNQLVSNAFQTRPGERGLNGARRISQPNLKAESRIAAFNRTGASLTLGISGLVSSAQHWVSARQIANSPGTSASGGFSGSMAEWCGVFTPYVKIVRPKFRKPTNYKHTCGEPEVTTRKLDSTGYAVCINPDISGLTNATEAEKAAVYQYLSTGVYYK